MRCAGWHVRDGVIGYHGDHDGCGFGMGVVIIIKPSTSEEGINRKKK